MKIANLSWDESGEYLYFSYSKALDTSHRGNPFEVKIYKIPWDSLKPKQVLQMTFDSPQLPLENLKLHGIHLFYPQQPLSFSQRRRPESVWVSVEGKRIGIDEEDYLYYVPNRWWKKRLYKVPRVPVKTNPYSHLYQETLVLRQPRWFPSGRYVIMEHLFWGVLILDPRTAEVGILANEKGNTFGWVP
jgi:hypothetical protein